MPTRALSALESLEYHILINQDACPGHCQIGSTRQPKTVGELLCRISCLKKCLEAAINAPVCTCGDCLPACDWKAAIPLIEQLLMRWRKQLLAKSPLRSEAQEWFPFEEECFARSAAMIAAESAFFNYEEKECYF